MPLHPTSVDLAMRLLLTLIAGAIMGFNRGEHGKPAGLRTTILVCLAASLSMILTNILLPTSGKTSDSFSVLDLMRLPLGILSGMGFIGAGTILRRNDLVTGVTTAATLWFVTMLGLCIGAGQYALSMGGLALGVAILWGARACEFRMARDQYAELTLVMSTGSDSPTPSGSPEAAVRDQLLHAGFTITALAFSRRPNAWIIRCAVKWRSTPLYTGTPPAILAMTAQPQVLQATWTPSGTNKRISRP